MIVDINSLIFELSVSGQHLFLNSHHDRVDGFERRKPKSFCTPLVRPGSPQGYYLSQNAPGILSIGPQKMCYLSPGDFHFSIYPDQREGVN